MALVVQDDTGTIAGANSYGSVAAFKEYHDARGNTYPATNSIIEGALVRATDYIDTRWQFAGAKKAGDAQTTEWPRLATDLTVNDSAGAWGGYYDGTGYVIPAARDCVGRVFAGLPTALVRACFEYALRALSSGLFQDSPAPENGRAIISERAKVDVIETETTYAATSVNPSFIMPVFPAADILLARACIIAPPNRGRLVVR